MVVGSMKYSRFEALAGGVGVHCIEGEYTGSSENFVIWCGIGGDRGGLLVNEILGTRRSTHYSGIHSARRSYRNAGDPCRELQVELSQGIRWTITETSPTERALASRKYRQRVR